MAPRAAGGRTNDSPNAITGRLATDGGERHDPDADEARTVPPTEDGLAAAADAVRAGELAVYPTETVYGLGADAIDPDAVERVFAAKGRSRNDPLSLAVPDLAAAEPLVELSSRERAFAERFLPGPVTLVCARTEAVPDVLTAGRERVGLRIPDDEVALALLDRVAPLTATSANVSGTGSVRDVADLSAELRAAVAVIVDAGPTPGGESTVVDVAADEVIRPGRNADAVERWLEEH